MVGFCLQEELETLRAKLDKVDSERTYYKNETEKLETKVGELLQIFLRFIGLTLVLELQKMYNMLQAHKRIRNDAHKRLSSSSLIRDVFFQEFKIVYNTKHLLFLSKRIKFTCFISLKASRFLGVFLPLQDFHFKKII